MFIINRNIAIYRFKKWELHAQNYLQTNKMNLRR
jgi:hypothetical protein